MYKSRESMERSALIKINTLIFELIQILSSSAIRNIMENSKENINVDIRS